MMRCAMTMQQWKPREIIVHERVRTDPVVLNIIHACRGTRVAYVESGLPQEIIRSSRILAKTKGFLATVLAGKQVMYVGPAESVVDKFDIKDRRLVCPHFDRLKLASNGCFYSCEWCYLRLTCRTVRPCITVHAEYDRIKEKLSKMLQESSRDVMYNSGEMADSLSLDHLTGAGRSFIPFFGGTPNGYLFMLTKSANVDHLLDLPHNGHTILAWSVNAPAVSRMYETGAPPFEDRIEAAYRAQRAGYRVRLRFDPIVPTHDWKSSYRETVKRIFHRVRPERLTLGTLRFEKGFYNMRETIFSPQSGLAAYVEKMRPMFEPDGKGRVGKYSFDKQKRIEMFSFVMGEIRKYSDCPVAICKEEPDVWKAVGLNLSSCDCVCQLDSADMSPAT
jgi:spore photoproduct lyase